LALHLAEARGCGSADLRAHWGRQIDRAAEASEQFLLDQRAQMEELATRYAQAPIMFILGAGPNIGTVEEASLKVIEMAKTFSEAQELENFLHGRLREVDSTTPLLLVAPHGKTSERLLDFLTVTDYVGAPSIVLTDQVSDDVQRLATHLVQMPAGLDELTTPLLYILPLYLLGYHMGLARGFDPAARRYPGIVPQEMRHQPGTRVK
jgi:glucosamine--fructose-6-phosphate aminotransferase (isomerizing)